MALVNWVDFGGVGKGAAGCCSAIFGGGGANHFKYKNQMTKHSATASQVLDAKT